MDVLITKAFLFGVHVRAPDFGISQVDSTQYPRPAEEIRLGTVDLTKLRPSELSIHFMGYSEYYA